MPNPERSTDDYVDTLTALEAFEALRRHGLPTLPAAILAAGIVVAEAFTGRT